MTLASRVDTTRVVVRVLAPLLAQGPVIRRPAMTAAAQRWHWNRDAGRVLADLRGRYGDGPLLLRVPGRHIAIVLGRHDVGRILGQSPEPFAATTVEKRAALGHFQPDGVLISSGIPRLHRRAFNEDVLETGRPVHHLAGSICGIIAEEARAMLGDGPRLLEWPAFAATFARVVRRIVLGDGAADDRRLSQLLDQLRRRGNLGYAAPHAEASMRALQSRLDRHLARAEPGSLASVIATTHATSDVHPYGQVPHWLFAYDALGASVFRALAVLAADRRTASSVDDERGASDSYRPRFSAVVLDTVRLWPTTLVVVRDTLTTTDWTDGTLPAGATLVVVSSFFHRDREHVAAADRLDLDSWLDGTFDRDPGIVPFSAGPVRCPGRDLVVLTGATMLAALLERHEVVAAMPRVDPARLPVDLDHFAIRLACKPRA